TINAKVDGTVEFDDLRLVQSTDDAGNLVDTVVSRSTEMKVIDDLGNIRQQTNIAYGTVLSVKNGAKVQKGQEIASWDPYNGVIIAESTGKIEYEQLEQGVTFQIEIDEQTGFQEKVISES